MKDSAGRLTNLGRLTVIGLVADTHLPRFGRRLPRALVDGLSGAAVSSILHLGDHTHALAVDLLSEIAPVEAVAGNNDGPELVERFGYARVVLVEGVRIGLTHGHLGIERATVDRALGTFGPLPAERVDVVAFGHSHIPLVEVRSGILLVNPGSPTDRRRQPAYSFGLLRIDEGGRVAAEVVRFADRRP